MPYRDSLIFVANNPIESIDESSDESKNDYFYLSDTDTIIKQQLI